ncbi:hypothetical protein N7488_003967 [Penicillium malachiteum]|nr:hypothetical protein N7488_003967 [Penicillium malachiteum]
MMISHPAKCDCSHCVPPQELLKSAEVIGNWQTKEDLFTHRIKQELLALKDITSLLATLKSKNPAPHRELDTATKDVLDGIINRRRRRTSVFNVREVQLVLSAWKYKCKRNEMPPKSLSEFVTEVLDPFASDAAKKAKSDCLAKRNKRKMPCGDLNLDEVEKELANTLFESATLDKIRETISKNPKGTFHFEYGCATFRYADAEKETPQVDKPTGPDVAVETIDEEEPTGNGSPKATEKKSDAMAELNLRIQKLEESLGMSNEDTEEEKATVFDRMEFLEAGFKRLQCAQEEIKRFTSELQEKLDEQPFSPFLNIDLAD